MEALHRVHHDPRRHARHTVLGHGDRGDPVSHSLPQSLLRPQVQGMLLLTGFWVRF